MGVASESVVLSEKGESGYVKKKSKAGLASRLLKYSAAFWFLAIMAGQWLFFFYIIKFYGFSVINDNMEIWNRWEPLGSSPHKAGDTAGNLLFAVHAIGAGIVAFGGALQLIPQVRVKAPTLHKVNGYLYLVTVFFLAMSGFYLSWIRGSSPDTISATGTSINGFLILGFAYLTVRCAIKKDIADHRKWAIRLFLVSNAQWFLRVGVFSYFITGTVAGGSPAFGDPFFPIWTFGCFLLPLATAQLYFYACESKNSNIKIMASGVLVLLTTLMMAGITGLTPFLLKIMSGEPIVF
ncbi:hypothetical protein HMF8227_00936 [Saliniradius amylolyticus]|uniref:DUF2306 domain-containing protein n=1 Tax=Saliniradius amylolyticus TaxID=2183582 RepID=A0A2S2E1A7_9ALTE|nr:DUF2306 domain-containing protein [Saliniradius amylolyticus]AWL11431.1 hypothetical protein HMF8227_00936 [Saliniradius amylolyticus]